MAGASSGRSPLSACSWVRSSQVFKSAPHTARRRTLACVLGQLQVAAANADDPRDCGASLVRCVTSNQVLGFWYDCGTELFFCSGFEVDQPCCRSSSIVLTVAVWMGSAHVPEPLPKNTSYPYCSCAQCVVRTAFVANIRPSL